MKKTLTFIALGVAFLAVSLWVWLSRGKNTKAVRAKFRLGGAIVALTSVVNLTSCGGGGVFGVDCYDPAPTNEIYWREYSHNPSYEMTAKNGDEISISCYYMTVEQVIVSIESVDSGEELQRTTYDVTDNSSFTLTHIINVGDYTGKAIVKFLLASEVLEPYEYGPSYQITITE